MVPELDAAYKPFPPYVDWTATVDTELWDTAVIELRAERDRSDPDDVCGCA